MWYSGIWHTSPLLQCIGRPWAAIDTITYTHDTRTRTHSLTCKLMHDILLVVLWAPGNANATAALCNLCSFRPACLRKVASPRIASHIESVDKADGLHARYGLKSWLLDRWPFLFLNGFPVARSRPWQPLAAVLVVGGTMLFAFPACFLRNAFGFERYSTQVLPFRCMCHPLTVTRPGRIGAASAAASARLG